MEKKENEFWIFMYSIYFISLFLNTTCIVVDYSQTIFVTKVMKDISLIYFFIKLILNFKNIFYINRKVINKNEFFLFIVFIILTISIIINYFITKSTKFLFLLLTFLSAYGVDYKKIIDRTYKLQFLLTFTTILLCAFGLIQNYTVTRGDNILRSSFGFDYVTNLPQMYMFSVILFLYSHKFKTSKISFLIFEAINIVIFYYTNSRTEFLLLSLILIISFISRFKRIEIIIKNSVKKICRFMANKTTLLPIISFIIMYFYKYGGIFIEINTLLSNRLKQTYDIYNEFGIKLFGSKIDMLGFGLKTRLQYGYGYVSNFVDNEYMNILFNGGLIIVSIMIYLIHKTLLILIKEKKYYEIVIILIYLLFGLINPRITTIIYCPILFIIMPTIFNYYRKKYKRRERWIWKNMII